MGKAGERKHLLACFLTLHYTGFCCGYNLTNHGEDHAEATIMHVRFQGTFAFKPSTSIVMKLAGWCGSIRRQCRRTDS